MCLVSQTKGLKVKKVTLRGHVYEKYRDIICDDNYGGCEYCQHEIEYIEPSVDTVVEACKSCKVDFVKPTINNK